MITQRQQNGLSLLVLENGLLRVELAPALGGKFTSIYNQQLAKEFLWHNKSLTLEKLAPGADYDSNFWGGIDELIPNDIPEEVNGIVYPDHGELWTTALEYIIEEDRVILTGTLPRCGLSYQKTISLQKEAPGIDVTYKIKNTSGAVRHFLWKLHAALQIATGDRLETSATTGEIVYPESSRFPTAGKFAWPEIEQVNASVVPDQNKTMDFFYLSGAEEGKMSMISAGGDHRFSYQYDKAVFPYQWYFASYGQFRDHYTAILEPATAMPVSVKEAAAAGQCSVLEPGAAINTSITIYAGGNI